MIQVIIVDDEPLIRNGLTRLIDWNKFRMEVKATFPNGALALEYIGKEQVDLAIVDIKMPIMDGIHLMRECQQRNYSCRFIVLSGYSDFEYVKQAARLGIENYLLKPVDSQELSQTLLQVTRKIDARQEQQNIVEEGIRILCNNLLYRLLLGEITYEELWERKEYLNISLEENDYQVAILKLLPKNPENAMGLRDKHSISQIIKFLEEKSRFVPITGYGERMLFLLFSNDERGKKGVGSDLENIMNYISITSPFCACVSVGLPAAQIEQIHDSYASALALANAADHNNNNAIYWAEEKADNEAALFPHIEFDQLILLNEKLAYQNESEIRRIVSDMLRANQKIPLNGLQTLAFLVASKIYSYMKVYGTVSDADMLRVEKQLNEAYSLPDYDSIQIWVSQIIDFLFFLEQNKSQGGTTNIKIILNYLHENYNKGINLKTIAEVFHINVLYLGRILKLETGRSFTDYINHLRIEEACNLLRNTDFSARQISERVGYNNDKYFNTQFKKYVGITPHEYYIKHRKEKNL